MSPRLLVLCGVLLLALVACSDSGPPGERAIPSQLPPLSREVHRRLALDGAHNLRDLGGYRTSDGRTTRWGVLYRSDALGDLTENDVAFLRRLGLRQVTDFRSDGERGEAPDRLPWSDELEVRLRPIQAEGTDVTDLQDRILSGQVTRDEMARLLVDGNRAFVSDFSELYAGFLRDLSEQDNLPALFHCTAGKDRAGFAAAVTLLALGVPRDTIMRDYLLTNEYTAEAMERRLRLIRIFSFFRTDPEDVRPLLLARSEYLQAAFDTIDAKYGTDDAYLSGGLGLDASTLEQLRANLLD